MNNGDETYSIYGKKIKLTEEQIKVLNYKGEKAQQVIKGVAGSGKSLVLMAKAQKLLNQQTLTERFNDVAFFAFNNTLVHYATEYLNADGTRDNYLRISTVDKYLNEIIKNLELWRNADYPNGKIINKIDRKLHIKTVLNELRKTDPRNTVYRVDDYTWSEEIIWAIDNGVTEENHRGYDYYSELRKNRGQHLSRKIRRDLNSAYAVIRGYINSIKRDDFTEMGLVYSYLEDHASVIQERMKFKHVLVDEAQDLSLTQMRLIKHLFSEDLVMAMDSNQRIYKNHWKFTDVGIQTHTSSLGKPFRCTKQIDDFAECIRRANDSTLDPDEIIPHTTPAEEGRKPMLIKCIDRDDENRAILGTAKALLEQGVASTGILFQKNKDVQEFATFLTDNGIDFQIIKTTENYTIRSPGLKLATIHSAKGLEFHNVIIPHVTKRQYKKDDGDISDSSRNLLYVACTRARVQLFITYSGSRSEYLDEVNRMYYVTEEK